MGKRGDRAGGFFEAEEEELFGLSDGGHAVEGVKATIGDEQAGAGERVAADKGSQGIVFIHEGSGLDDCVDIAIFQYVEGGGGMELVIAAITGIVVNEGIGVHFIRGDIDIGAVAGDETHAKEGLSAGKGLVEAMEQ